MARRKANETDSPYLTTQQAADYWQVTERTIRKFIDDGTLPAVKVGQQLRIARADLARAARPARIA